MPNGLLQHWRKAPNYESYDEIIHDFVRKGPWVSRYKTPRTYIHYWSWKWDLNPRPIDYESIALPLRHSSVYLNIVAFLFAFVKRIALFYQLFFNHGGLVKSPPHLLSKLSKKSSECIENKH